MWWTLIDLVEDKGIREFLTEDALVDYFEEVYSKYQKKYHNDIVVDDHYDKMYVVIRWA